MLTVFAENFPSWPSMNEATSRGRIEATGTEPNASFKCPSRVLVAVTVAGFHSRFAMPRTSHASEN